MLTAIGISSIVVSGCADSSLPTTTEGQGDFESDTSLAATVVEDVDDTVSADSCVPQSVSEDDAPLELNEALGSGPFVGTGGIWTVVPTDDWFEVLNSDPASFDAFVKLAWFRFGVHDLEVVMEDPDGNMPAGAFDASPDAYAEEGVLPSSLIFDSPGCWTVRATYGPDTLEFPLWVPSE